MSQPTPEIPDAPNPIVDEPQKNAAVRQQIAIISKTVPLPLVLSIVAIVISLSSCMWMVFSNPAGKACKRYNFSTPKASLFSLAEMGANNDVLAQRELMNLSDSLEMKERLKTLKVNKEAEWKGKKILFISYDRNGLTRYDTSIFEKDDKTGFWLPARRSRISDIRDDDRELAKAMQEWQENSDKKKKD